MIIINFMNTKIRSNLIMKSIYAVMLKVLRTFYYYLLLISCKNKIISPNNSLRFERIPVNSTIALLGHCDMMKIISSFLTLNRPDITINYMRQDNSAFGKFCKTQNIPADIVVSDNVAEIDAVIVTSRSIMKTKSFVCQIKSNVSIYLTVTKREAMQLSAMNFSLLVTVAAKINYFCEKFISTCQLAPKEIYTWQDLQCYSAILELDVITSTIVNYSDIVSLTREDISKSSTNFLINYNKQLISWQKYDKYKQNLYLDYYGIKKSFCKTEPQEAEFVYKEYNNLFSTPLNNWSDIVKLAEIVLHSLPNEREFEDYIFSCVYYKIITSNATMVVSSFDQVFDQDKPTLLEKHIIANPHNTELSLKHKKLLWAEISNDVESYHNMIHQSENNSKYIHFENNGMNRVTTNKPESYDFVIYIFGNSRVLGSGCEDKYTIASYLQRKINSNKNNMYLVKNYSGVTCFFDFYKKINGINFKKGDIVILGGLFLSNNFSFVSRENFTFNPKYFESYNYIHCDVNIKRRKVGEEVFWDYLHFNHIGNRIVSEQLYEFLFSKRGIICDLAQNKDNDNPLSRKGICINESNIVKFNNKRNDNINLGSSPMLIQYQQFLNDFNFGKDNKTTGSIVMNCNPFTHGHRYLIEWAANTVDELIVFILEEDKSYFPFSDRIELVKKGVKDLENVIVVPSGQFIISNITFKSYFQKEEKKEKIDASLDLDVFGKYLAPYANITKRFVGDEPLCVVTSQYNDQMLQILPKYGIEVVVIPRKEFDGTPISASRVRQCIKDKQKKELIDIVPKTTYDYLLENYF